MGCLWHYEWVNLRQLTQYLVTIEQLKWIFTKIRWIITSRAFDRENSYYSTIQRNKLNLLLEFEENSRISLYITPFQALYWKKRSNSRNAYVMWRSSFLCMWLTHTRFAQTMLCFLFIEKRHSFDFCIVTLRNLAKMLQCKIKRNDSNKHLTRSNVSKSNEIDSNSLLAYYEIVTKHLEEPLCCLPKWAGSNDLEREFSAFHSA